MPGFDRSGPMGAGSMTGVRRGFCNPGRSAIERPVSRGYGFGAGYGFRGGYGPGRGVRKGFCGGFAWYPSMYEPGYPTDQTSEMNMLRAEADSMKTALDTINKRIVELEKSSE
jgi:hypothetical protein